MFNAIDSAAVCTLDQHLIDDVVVTYANDGDFCRQFIAPVQKRMIHFWIRETFDEDLAMRCFRRIAKEAIARYAATYGMNVRATFDKGTREAIAEGFMVEASHAWEDLAVMPADLVRKRFEESHTISNDKPANRQAFCEYIDFLQKDGQICEEQAFILDNPY